MLPTSRFHQLEPILKSLDGLVIVNKPPVSVSGLMEGDRFFTCLYNNQYYCVEVEDKHCVVVKVYLRLSPWTKQRAMETVFISNNNVMRNSELDKIIETVRDTAYQTKPLPKANIQQIYGGSGFHPLSGYYMQLSKRFLDSLGEREHNILNELDYIENTLTTHDDKHMILRGYDGQEFRYNLARMEIM